MVLDRVLFSPRKCLDRDFDRTDLALLVLLLSSTSGLSSYFALWILQEKLVNNPARGPIGYTDTHQLCPTMLIPLASAIR